MPMGRPVHREEMGIDDPTILIAQEKAVLEEEFVGGSALRPDVIDAVAIPLTLVLPIPLDDRQCRMEGTVVDLDFWMTAIEAAVGKMLVEQMVDDGFQLLFFGMEIGSEIQEHPRDAAIRPFLMGHRTDAAVLGDQVIQDPCDTRMDPGFVLRETDAFQQ